MSRYKSFIKAFGLSGKDGDLSFSKTLDLTVLACYFINANLPWQTAVVLVVSGHGTKVLIEAIQAWGRKGAEGLK